MKNIMRKPLEWYKERYIGKVNGDMTITDVIIDDLGKLKVVAACKCGNDAVIPIYRFRLRKSCGFENKRNVGGIKMRKYDYFVGIDVGIFKIIGFDKLNRDSYRYQDSLYELECSHCKNISYRRPRKVIESFARPSGSKTMCRKCGESKEIVIDSIEVRERMRDILLEIKTEHPLLKHALYLSNKIHLDIRKMERVDKVLKIIEKVPNYENEATLRRLDKSKGFITENLYWERYMWLIYGPKSIFEYPRSKYEIRLLIDRYSLIASMAERELQYVFVKGPNARRSFCLDKDSTTAKVLIKAIVEMTKKNGGIIDIQEMRRNNG